MTSEANSDDVAQFREKLEYHRESLETSQLKRRHMDQTEKGEINALLTDESHVSAIAKYLLLLGEHEAASERFAEAAQLRLTYRDRRTEWEREMQDRETYGEEPHAVRDALFYALLSADQAARDAAVDAAADLSETHADEFGVAPVYFLATAIADVLAGEMADARAAVTSLKANAEHAESEDHRLYAALAEMLAGVVDGDEQTATAGLATLLSHHEDRHDLEANIRERNFCEYAVPVVALAHSVGVDVTAESRFVPDAVSDGSYPPDSDT